MTMNKFVKKLLVVVALLCTTMMFVACGDDTEAPAGDKEYKVAVKDAYGTPYTDGVVVLFYQGDTQVGMQIVDKTTGVAAKTLPAGDYTVKLQFTLEADGFYYEEEGLSLSADKTELDLVLHKAIAEEPYSLYVGEGQDGPDKLTGDWDGYNLYTGSTYVELAKGERNYFIFTPTEPGTYEISILEGENLTLGYYGVTHYVRRDSIAKTESGKFTVSISKGMIGQGETGTTNLVIGVDSVDTDKAILGVARIGEPEKTVEDEPWTTYEATDKINPYKLPTGTVLKDFDLTASGYNVVYNETDGYYHLNSADGPLIYVNLVQDNRYMGSFKTIMEEAGVAKYYYDDNGNFVKRVSFFACLEKYIAAADEEKGVYPLNNDLKYIIQEHGGYVGWWELGTPTSIFVDNNWNPLPGINADIAWLFMCCYAE